MLGGAKVAAALPGEDDSRWQGERQRHLPHLHQDCMTGIFKADVNQRCTYEITPSAKQATV